MKKVIKIASYILIAAFFAVSLSGCTKKDSTTNNEIVVWSFEDPDVWKPIITAFQNKNKGYTVTYQKQVLNSGYESRVLNSMMSGFGPDVWAMPNDWVYRHKEKLYPMPSTLAKSINLDKQFVPVIKQSVYFDNNIYALSPTAEPLVIYYNQKLIGQIEETLTENNKNSAEVSRIRKILGGDIPSTWTDFVEMTKLLTVKSGSTITSAGVAMGSDKLSYAPDLLYLLMLQNNTQIISSDYSIATLNLPESTATGSSDTPGKRALEFYTSFTNPASTNYSWNDTFGDPVDAFATGKVAMIFGYPSLANTLLQKYPNFNYRKTFVPQITSDANQIKDFATFNAFGVNKLSANPTAAWYLVVLLVGDEASDFASGARQYSSNRASSYEISITNRTGTNPEKLELATAQSVIKSIYPEEFDTYIRSMIASVNNKTISSQNALDLTANNITNLFREESWQ